VSTSATRSNLNVASQPIDYLSRVAFSIS
jgi:hypothetical protein